MFAVEEQKSKHQSIEGNGSSVTNMKSGSKCHLLVLPSQGKQGFHLVKFLKQSITKLLPKTTQLELGFTGSKLSTHFQIKDKTKVNIIMRLFIWEHVQRTIAQVIMLVKAHIVSLRE